MSLPKPLDPGSLRHRVTLQRDLGTASASTAGQVVSDWTTIGDYWSCVTPLQGRELVNALQIKATISHKIELRQVTAIFPRDRFLYTDALFGTSRVFNVEVVLRRGERNEAYDILVTELQGEVA